MKKKYFIYIIPIILIIVGSIWILKMKDASTIKYSTNDLTQIKVNQEYNKNKKINEDYVGLLKFDSGLIEEDVVQGETNETYLRTDWHTGKYDEEGSVFMDSESNLADQNITLYGHYVYESYDSSRTHKFTPLELLLEEENYEANKTLTLKLENETRKYMIVAVYLCNLLDELVVPENLKYYTTNFTEETFATYKQEVEKIQQYDTRVSYDFNDKFLTLQTCVKNHPEQRQIVLCKEI